MGYIYAPGALDDGSDAYVIASYNSAGPRENEIYLYSLDHDEEGQLDHTSKLRDKATDEDDTQDMSEPHDYRHELSLRDDQIRREMDLRQESFRAEQAARDKALDEKFSGFLAAQTERDKASDYRFGRIESDLSSIKGDLKTVNSDVHEIRRTLARYMGGIAVGAAVAGIVIGAAVKFLFN
ncbi:hypothetical protein CFBP3846_03671 [Pseudomonas syringae pv. avii]|uniref:Uncharacterized protein n=3 Tax=Pseudomonas TaxID=286 RepID=A0ABY1U9G8_PSESX|nr:hypothetical protein CFBP1573P_03039 [Pseudomonas syringae pv. persicae]SOQ11881.1 hypothetical protein NCPPB2254_03593 [Pseudomonas syringae pv. persicae]SOS28078.1 hypothetical protein CFBP3846_03671 [Pseudomonas syringae pv. avii]